MIRLSVGLLSLILVFFVAGCGYLAGGTWSDDPRNFERAWGYPKPDDVELVHSWYWRAPHFTREEAYFFQFRANQKLFNALLDTSRFAPVTIDVGWNDKEPTFCYERPGWFTPNRSTAYEAWRGPSGTDAWMFRDRRTGDLFVYACQL